MTTVVNLYKELYDIYIGRSGKGKDGYFGNPHPIGFCKMCDCIHDRETSILAFNVYFNKRIKSDSEFVRRLQELKGKRLGCFCKPNNSCHGDIIVEYLENN